MTAVATDVPAARLGSRGSPAGPATIAASRVPTASAATLAEVDRRAVEHYGITVLQLMEQAGSHLAELVRVEAGGDLRGRVILVAVGPGSTGGGGLAAARHLAGRGADVRVVLAHPALRMTEAGRHQLATLLAMGTSCCVATYDLPDDELEAALAGAAVVVDAILGRGVRGAPHDEVERLIGFVARSGRPVISLDVPSGMDPDTGEAAGIVVTAVATLALGMPARGLLGMSGAAHGGRLYLGDLGLPNALYADLGLAGGTLFAGGRIVALERPA